MGSQMPITFALKIGYSYPVSMLIESTCIYCSVGFGLFLKWDFVGMWNIIWQRRFCFAFTKYNFNIINFSVFS